MKIREDALISLRSMKNHLVETILLTVGIALGIGATSAAVAVVARTMALEAELATKTEYREITVTPTAEAENIGLAALAQESDERVVLSTADLQARSESPDVTAAYIMNNTEMRFGNFIGNFGGRGGDLDAPPPGEEAAGIGNEGIQRPDPEKIDSVLSEIGNPQPIIEEIDALEVSYEFFAAYGITTARGSVFTEADSTRGAKLLVLGSDVPEAMFEDGIAVGRKVLANLELYTIIGILEETGTDLDNQVLLPARTAESSNSGLRFRLGGLDAALHFMVEDPDRLDEAKYQLASWFAAEYGEGAVQVDIPREEFEYLQDRNYRIVGTILFLSLAGLLIVAVNVSNILYTRALKNRKNAGILKALGASRTNVFRTFFVEAAGVSLLGGLTGIGVSVVLGLLFDSVLGLGGLNPVFIAAGLAASLGISMGFMLMPAKQVSRIPAAVAMTAS